MRKTYPFLLLFAGSIMAPAQPVQVVAPNNLANVEGNSSTSEPFNAASFRFQQVFSASQFASFGSATGRVDSIAFRIDATATGNAFFSFGGGSVTFSTTSRAPDSLSPVFSDNVGGDAVTIYNGPLSFGGLYQSGANPQPFGQTIPATSAFFYSPARGNLLVDIRGRSGQVLFPGLLDAQAATGDSVSRVLATSELLPSGTADSLGLVARFDVVVIPEPASWLIFATGLSIAASFRRKL